MHWTYPISLDMGPGHLLHPPLLLTSGGHHWRPVQTCSLEDLTPPPTQVLITSGGHWSGRYTSYWNAVFFTVRNEVAKVMFLHLSVILFMGRGLWFCSRGGVCLSACWDTTPSPQEQTPPPEQTATAADGTHPTGIHSSLSVYLLFLWKATWLLRPQCVVHWLTVKGCRVPTFPQ